ncbi:MAG: hypothetical protein AB7N91_32880 [Candidatus Tectimicrobiota bacterium]
MNQHRQRVTARGISLVETMVALVVIVVGLTALRYSFPANLALERQAVERMQATLLGKSQLDTMRLQGFAALVNTPGIIPPEPFRNSQQHIIDSTFRWQAEIQREADDLLAIQLRVVWPWPAQTHQVRLATYVSRH